MRTYIFVPSFFSLPEGKQRFSRGDSSLTLGSPPTFEKIWREGLYETASLFALTNLIKNYIFFKSLAEDEDEENFYFIFPNLTYSVQFDLRSK
jgi:hypothetical protein